MELRFLEKEENATILALEDDVQVGEITYVKSGDGEITIDHTEVEPFIRGRGIAKILVEKVVDIARENGWKIVPACPFAQAEFDKNPDYQDVLA